MNIKKWHEEHNEKLRQIKAGEILCDFCDVKLTIPVCPRCGNQQANVRPRDRTNA
jgi:hypothetical protein